MNKPTVMGSLIGMMFFTLFLTCILCLHAEEMKRLDVQMKEADITLENIKRENAEIATLLSQKKKTLW